MELSLTVHLIFGISMCFAAPLDEPNNNISSICINSTDLMMNQGDIFKNCNYFKDINNTLCTLYYNSLSSYCQWNKNIDKYPNLEEIRKKGYDIDVICENLVPSLKTILKKDVRKIKITCYYLCAEFDDIKPECLYAYYYNTSKNMTDNGTPISKVNTEKEISNKSEKVSGNFPSSDTHKTMHPNPNTGDTETSINQEGELPSFTNNKGETVTIGDQPSTPVKSSPVTIRHTEINTDSNIVHDTTHRVVSDPKLQNSLPDASRDNPLDNIPLQEVFEEVDKDSQQDIDDTFAKQDDVQEEVVDQKTDKKPDFVQDNPVNSENMDEIDGESYFFTYFMVICILFILGYVGYHNRLKVFALLLEGKRGNKQHRGRRPNSANYHKLDTNLEEAISSNVNKNPSNVIF